MANIIETVTVDGATPFTLDGVLYDWIAGFGNIFHDGSPNDNHDVDINISGSNWLIEQMIFRSDTNNVWDLDINDTGAGVDRDVKILDLGIDAGTVDVNLTDTRVRYIRNGEAGVDINVTLGSERTTAIELFDSTNTINAGSGTINAILMGHADNTINGGTGRIGSIELGDGDNDVTTGTGNIDAINAGHGKNSFTATNGGGISFIQSGDGKDTLVVENDSWVGGAALGRGNNKATISDTASMNFLSGNEGNDNFTLKNDAGVEFISLGHGNNKLNMSQNAWVSSVRGRDDRDTLKIGGTSQINQADLGHGNNKVTVSGSAKIDSLQTGDDDDTVTISGNARIDQMSLGEGNNTITTANRWIANILTWDGDQTLTVGSGGVGHIKFGVGSHTVTADGHVNSMDFDGSASSTIVLNDGAGALQLADGVDNVTTNSTGSSWFELISTRGGDDQVMIGDDGGSALRTGDGNDNVSTTGWIELISTGDGADNVTLGTMGSGMVRLGDDDDHIIINEMDPNSGVRVDGGNGNDTADFSNFGTKLVLSLEQSGVWQNPAAPGGDLSTPALGYVNLGRIENIIGGRKADRITGSDGDNILDGERGSDRLFGLDGQDTLIGGIGNDQLTGGADADTFQFAANHGTDRIKDFEIGIDQIEILGATQLSDLGFATAGANVEVTFGALTVIVENVTIGDLQDASNFLF